MANSEIQFGSFQHDFTRIFLPIEQIAKNPSISHRVRECTMLLRKFQPLCFLLLSLRYKEEKLHRISHCKGSTMSLFTDSLDDARHTEEENISHFHFEYVHYHHPNIKLRGFMVQPTAYHKLLRVDDALKLGILSWGNWVSLSSLRKIGCLLVVCCR